MRRSKTEALVVGKMPLRETSLLLTLLTDRFGLVKAVAKGSRTPRKRFWKPLELLAHLEVVLYRGHSSDLALLTSAEALDMHTAMLGDTQRFGCGCALAELGRAVAPKEHGCEDLLALLCTALSTIEHAPKSGLETVFWGVCLKSLYLLGHGPHLLSCVRCQRELEDRQWFSVREGGMLCGRCRRQDDEAVPVSPSTVALLTKLMTSSLDALATQDVGRSDFGAVRRLIDRFFLYHLNVRPGRNSLEFLRQMERPPSARGP